MGLLVDTHIALWSIFDSPDLPARARSLLSDGATDAYVSEASVWEVSIKHAGHPDRMQLGAMEFAHLCESSGFELLPIEVPHMAEAERLPYEHKDPFDRLLYGQARAEKMVFLTHDKNIALLGGSQLLIV